MPWPDGAQPVRMQRVAVVAPAADAARRAGAGGRRRHRRAGPRRRGGAGARRGGPAAGPAARARAAAPRAEPRSRPTSTRSSGTGGPTCWPARPQLEERAAAAVARGRGGGAGRLDARRRPRPAAASGWPRSAAPPSRWPGRPGGEPPTLLRETGARRPFAPLVDTYATVRYADVDPTVLAGIAYVVMFGMMFADAGHGAVLLVLAPCSCAPAGPGGWPGCGTVWPFLAGAGAGQRRLRRPLRRVLRAHRRPPGALAGRRSRSRCSCWSPPSGSARSCWPAPTRWARSTGWREGGWRLALYASSGLAGAGLFLGLGLLAAGWY